MAEFLGGRTKQPGGGGVTQQLDADGVPVVEEYNHDNLAQKYRMQRDEMMQKEIARQIRQIDDNIRRIDDTIKRLEGDTVPDAASDLSYGCLELTTASEQLAVDSHA